MDILPTYASTQSMFDRLLTLPLFQGMDTNELSNVLTHVKLDFVKYQAGDDIVCQGDASKSLVCVINGILSSILSGDDFSLHETALHGVTMIEPYNMFGMRRCYSRTYSFATDGEVLTLDREVFLNHIMNSRIVKVNMLNIVCNQYQKTQQMLWERNSNDVSTKIVQLIRSMSSWHKGEKVLKIKMTDLSAMLNETRLNVSQALNSMEERKLLTLKRGIIVFHDISAQF